MISSEDERGEQGGNSTESTKSFKRKKNFAFTTWKFL